MRFLMGDIIDESLYKKQNLKEPMKQQKPLRLIIAETR